MKEMYKKNSKIVKKEIVQKIGIVDKHIKIGGQDKN